MPSTLILQSFHAPPHPVWLMQCLQSVRAWSEKNQFDYKFVDDSLFDYLHPSLMKKLSGQTVIATDLARLYSIRDNLAEFDRVVWLDADFLIFSPDNFLLPTQVDLSEGYMVGREVWIQAEAESQGKLKAFKKVHNAFLLFDRGNSFLDFYLEHAERLVKNCEGPMPPQFIGPKLLTALHNVVGCPAMESAGMLSPLVIDDLLSDGAKCCALNLMKKRSTHPIAGANLCYSLSDNNHRSPDDMLALVTKLTAEGNEIGLDRLSSTS